MKCPNCGAEMPVGSLYCEQCGEDIHIVPDFEPEVEFNIQQTINGIAEDINEDRELIEDDDIPLKQNKTVRKEKRFKWKLFMMIVVGAMCVIALIGGILAYQYYSLDFQLDRARKYASQGEYEKSIEHYLRVLELTGDNVDIIIKFELADAYFMKNNKIEYEYLLRDIVKDRNATDEQIESAYGKLIAIYRAREDFKSINELLLASENEDVMYTYQNYVAMPPEFSIQEGYYADIQPLKLTAYGNGKIYYTTDGSEPDENSTQYTTPIILDDGDYTVRAYFVNEYGIASDYASKTYHIQIEALPIPEVITVSGEYKFPTNIEIEDDDEEIYYTTDGTEPTLSSSRYTGPIPMPLGKSNYKFIRINGGRNSEIVERTFRLEMNTEYTPQEAETDLVAYLIQCGKIYDEAGRFEDSDAMYKYQYQYVTNINRVDDFYVIAEIFRDTEKMLTKTGNYYAVNAYTGKIYKLQINENYNYTLVELEEQPTE